MKTFAVAVEIELKSERLLSKAWKRQSFDGILTESFIEGNKYEALCIIEDMQSWRLIKRRKFSFVFPKKQTIRKEIYEMKLILETIR